MKAKEKQALREAPVAELIKKLGLTQQSLARLERERYTKQSKNTREGKGIKQMIARIKTMIREKELTV